MRPESQAHPYAKAEFKSIFQLRSHEGMSCISHCATPQLQGPREQADTTCLGTRLTCIIQRGIDCTDETGTGSGQGSDRWSLLSGALALRPPGCYSVQD